MACPNAMRVILTKQRFFHFHFYKITVCLPCVNCIMISRDGFLSAYEGHEWGIAQPCFVREHLDIAWKINHDI